MPLASVKASSCAAVEPAWFEAIPLPGIHAWLANWLRSAIYIAVMRKA